MEEVSSPKSLMRLYENSHMINVVTFNSFHLQFGILDQNILDVKDADGILSIKKNGVAIVRRSDKIYVQEKGWYQLNDITLLRKRNGIRVYRGSTMQRTDSSLMLLPFIGGTKRVFGYEEHLVNAFCFRENYEGIQRIWVLMKMPVLDHLSFRGAISLFRQSPYLEREEVLGTEHQMFTFLIPEGFKKDHELFLQSKFSRMSKGAKDRIYDFHGITDRNNKLRMQLERSARLRKNFVKDLTITPENPPVIDKEDELRSLLKPDRETFKNKYIIDEYRITKAENES